jgi:hypothetical protein
MPEAQEPRRTSRRRPYQVRMPRFVSDDDVGLGDVITHATSALGIPPCRGCTERAAALNEWVRFGNTGPVERGQ